MNTYEYEPQELVLSECDGCGTTHPFDSLHREGVPAMWLCDECLKNEADAEIQ